MKNVKITLIAAVLLLLAIFAVWAVNRKNENARETETTVRIGALKGPTSMGLVSLMEKSEAGSTANAYEFTMVSAADELLARIVSGKLDIALVPANTASILYNKTEGGICVIDINTFGVLYLLEGGRTIQSVKDLEGKSIYLTGKGTTPDYVLQYLLKENGLSEDAVNLEYKSEATEVVSALATDHAAIGLLPQPFVTAAMMQNEQLRIALDLTEEWEKVQPDNGSSLVTGVTIVRREFLENSERAVQEFLSEHEASAAFTNENPAEASERIAELGIVQQAAVAQKAIPYCNITCVQGNEMREALEGYLEVLYALDASTVGGALPPEDFYYIP